uniref:Uncharacterized protein n=1 Tax=Meloidogyne enterolobii TaxID=390850 RepID=A0A6V7XTJ7_MELEN|nr:unnamed protein product [Meloidogyne enterolobii]
MIIHLLEEQIIQNVEFLNQHGVCDPDGMLTDQQRKEIVHMVEDFKEKTKRPNSIHPCMREGLRLVVALAKVKISPSNDSTVDFTELCANNSRRWTSTDPTKCESNVQGIEVNLDGFSYCRWIHLFMALHKDEYEQLQRTGIRNSVNHILCNY